MGASGVLRTLFRILVSRNVKNANRAKDALVSIKTAINNHRTMSLGSRLVNQVMPGSSMLELGEDLRGLLLIIFT